MGGWLIRKGTTTSRSWKDKYKENRDTGHDKSFTWSASRPWSTGRSRVHSAPGPGGGKRSMA